jgi:hypothetical protein
MRSIREAAALSSRRIAIIAGGLFAKRLASGVRGGVIDGDGASQDHQ